MLLSFKDIMDRTKVGHRLASPDEGVAAGQGPAVTALKNRKE